jgi:hypothetical protein
MHYQRTAFVYLRFSPEPTKYFKITWKRPPTLELAAALHLSMTEFNLGNRNVKALLASGQVETVAYFCGKFIAELLLRTPHTPVGDALLAAVLTAVGKAPNERVTESRLAVALAQSALLSSIGQLPIFGAAPETGRAFSLGSGLKCYIPLERLGSPWNRN